MCTNYMTVTHRPSWQRWLDQLGAEGCTDTDLELPAQPHIFNHYPAPFVRWRQHAGVASVQALTGVFGLIPCWAKERKGSFAGGGGILR